MTVFTRRGDNSCAARVRCCQIRLIDGSSPRPYQVIGVLEIQAFAVRSIPRREAAFLELVRPAVCKAGGDGVIPGVDGDGRYVLATVVKWAEPGAGGPACPSPSSETADEQPPGSTPEPTPEQAAKGPAAARAPRDEQRGHGDAPC